MYICITYECVCLFVYKSGTTAFEKCNLANVQNFYVHIMTCICENNEEQKRIFYIDDSKQKKIQWWVDRDRDIKK